MKGLTRRLALVALAAISAASLPWSLSSAGLPQAGQASGQKPAQAEQPRFRTSTELVVVDVSAIGKDGAPVKGLQAEDFTVRIDGGLRRIASMKFVDQSTGQAPAAPARPGVRYSSNEYAGSGRLIVILVDEGSIRFGGLRAAAESIDRLLDGFGPADRIALVTLPNARMLVDFTADRARIAAAIKNITGGTSTGGLRPKYYVSVAEAFAIERRSDSTLSEVIARECVGDPACPIEVETEAKAIVTTERNRTAEFVGGLRGMLTALRAIDAPKLVVVFSEGFASPESPIEMVTFGRDAAEARAVIYAMRLDRSMFDAGRPMQLSRALFTPNPPPPPMMDALDDRRAAIAGLDALTGSARGTTFEIIGSAEDPFKRLASEVSGYYLIGVEPEANDRDGKLHQIKVEVNRPGVTIRSRREFAYKPFVTDESKLFTAAMASPLPATDLPLRVATFNLVDDDPSKVHVLVVAEIGRTSQPEGSATVGFLLADEKGKVPFSAVRPMKLQGAESGALLYMGKFPVPAGTYTMKFAAVFEGRVGSVEHHVVAALTPREAAGMKPAGSALQVGDVIVVPPTAAKSSLSPPLDGRVRGDRVVGFAQVGTDPRAKDERTYTFDVVKEESGPALLSMPGSFDPSAKGRVRTVEANVDARLLPPGDYGMRLTISAPGAAALTLYSSFSLERPAPVARPATVAGPPSPASAPAAPPADAVKFRPQDVLDPAVLGPFLDEVSRLAPEASRPALEPARAGRFDEALQQAKPGRPNDPTAPFLRGLSLLAKGQNQDASNAFREAIAAEPQLLVGAFYIGACFAAAGNDRGAINAWQTSLIGLSRYRAVYGLLADALIRTGQSGRALALLGQAAKQWPDDPALGARVMRASLEAGRYTQALDYADQIIARQPSDSATLFLAMRAIFQAVLEGADVDRTALLPRLERYQEMYRAASGPQQALVAEWVAFVKTRA